MQEGGKSEKGAMRRMDASRTTLAEGEVPVEVLRDAGRPPTFSGGSSDSLYA